ncbi:uncharacterized protein [Nicotiana tomentosiformis]|uniref:uncharacterized protein n=1 Tax=Nicotiana tomentosiformis TaxID=4098 RepID=UPI00388C6C3A
MSSYFLKKRVYSSFSDGDNVAAVAQVSDVVSELKEWVEGLVSQRLYSEHARMELSKGRWEARNHGLPKDVAMRPPSDEEDVPLKSPAPKQGDEKKRKRASVLHHETFLRYREELTHHEAEVRDLTEKSDTYNLLSEKLQADLVTAQNEHAEMAEQAQVDTIQAEAGEFKKNMDILVSKREAAQAQLESAETQLRAAKEKASVQVKKIEELQSQLDLVISNKANLANELEAAKSEVVVANTKADAKVSQFKVNFEAIQAQAKSMADHARWASSKGSPRGSPCSGLRYTG